MELRLPGRFPGGLWPHGQTQSAASPSLEALISGARTPPPGSVATAVGSAAELPPKGMMRFPVWLSYLVPTTLSVFDNLYSHPLKITVKEPVRRTSFYHTEKLQQGIFAVSCYVHAYGKDLFMYGIGQTKREAMSRLKQTIRSRVW